MKIDESRKAAESGETLPESALDTVSGGFIERDTGADATAHDSPSGKRQGGFFKPLD